MSEFFHSITSFVLHYGYAAIFGAILFESFGFPLPGETLIIVSSVLASKGHFNIFWIVSLSISATFVGNSIGYAIGFFGGRKLVLKYGEYIFLDENNLSKMETFFSRHGSKIVTFGRFIIGVRQFNGIVAGISKMDWWRFFWFNLLGAVLWVGLWSSAAFLWRNKLIHFLAEFEYVGECISIISIILVVTFIVFLFIKNKKIEKSARR